MSVLKTHAPGSFCWFELATDDSVAASRFYRELFEWTADELPMEPGRRYTLFKREHEDVAALRPLDTRQRAAGIPPHWLVYVSVACVDDSAERARTLGGRVITTPNNVAQAGRMALVADPTGGRIALWQAHKHAGAAVLNELNAPCWFELQTRNVGIASVFYSGLFSWNARMTSEANQYTEVIRNGISIGGMTQVDSPGSTVEPRWAIYFAVEDCAAIAKKVTALDGKVIVPSTQIGKTMRFAMFLDPQGAPFSVLQL